MVQELRSCSASKITLQRLHEPDEAGIVLHLTTKKGETYEFTMTLSKGRDLALDLSGLTGLKPAAD